LKLIDFGLTVPDEPPFKMPGNRTGTPQYMAPEVVRRRSTDLRLDIFSLGVTIYRMLTFEHPWGSVETTGLAALAHDTREPNSIFDHRPHLHPSLAGAVERCLQVNPDKRPKSVKHFLALFKDLKKEDV
jgi:serine/threonine-protein kinase